MAQIKAPVTHWETYIKFLPPGFGLAQSDHCRLVGTESGSLTPPPPPHPSSKFFSKVQNPKISILILITYILHTMYSLVSYLKF